MGTKPKTLHPQTSHFLVTPALLQQYETTCATTARKYRTQVRRWLQRSAAQLLSCRARSVKAEEFTCATGHAFYVTEIAPQNQDSRLPAPHFGDAAPPSSRRGSHDLLTAGSVTPRSALTDCLR